MKERNESRYQLEQNNRTYIFSTSLVDDKIRLKCQDSNNQIYIGTFRMEDLYLISQYFRTTVNVEEVQLYLNGIIEKQRVGIFPKNNSINLVLYLINNDKINIPLNKKIENINTYNPYASKKKNVIPSTPQLNYIHLQKNEIYHSPQKTTNFTDYSSLMNPDFFDFKDIFQQNSNKYNSLTYLAEPNITTTNNYINANNFEQILTNNQIFEGNNIISDTNNIISDTNNIISDTNNVITYTQPDNSYNNYFTNVQFEDYNNNNNNNIIINNNNNNANSNIKSEEEKIKNELKKVLNENDKYKEENEKLQNKINSLINEVEQLKKNNIIYQSNLEKYKTEVEKEKQEYIAIENNSRLYKVKNDELIQIKEKTEEENKILKKNLDNYSKENKELKNENEDLKNKIKILSEKNISLSEEINSLKNYPPHQEKATINEDEIKRLMEENSEFRLKAEENEELKKQIQDLKEQIEKSKETNDDIQEYDEDNEKEVKGDIIQDMKELDMITKKINKENKRLIINLIYKASADSDKASVFHEKCDKAKNTIVLVETSDGHRFGGYTTCSWSGDCVDKFDENAFIFSFDKMKTYDNIPGDEAIGCYPKFGPIFLGCQIKINDNAFTNGGTTFEKELNFNTKEDYELTGGERFFNVKDIEVYEVIFE
jgi:hypothetical protein